MKKFSKALVVLCAAALLAACVMPASASSFTRKFNGFHAVNKQNPNLYTTDGTSTYADGVVTCTFPKTGAGCWQYITGSTTDIHFQFRIDTATDPEFDWVGVNVTNDGEAFLGEGTGLSTLIWRTTDSINTRLVKDEDGARWDNVAGQELMSGELYTGEAGLEEPYEDYRWGDGQWIDYHIYQGSNGSWKVEVDGKDIIRTPYKNFDADMNAVFGSGKRLTLSLFLSNASGVVQVRGVEGTTATTTNNNTTASTTASHASGTTGSTAAGSTAGSNAADASTTDAATDPTAGGDISAPGDSSDESALTGSTAATTAAGATLDDGTDKAEKGGFPVWAIVVIAVVVIGGGAVAVLLVMKKKK